VALTNAPYGEKNARPIGETGMGRRREGAREVEWPEQRRAEASVGERIEQRVAADDRRRHQPRAAARQAKCGRKEPSEGADHRSHEQRVTGAAMAEGVFIGDAEARADDVDVGQH
jgi:hypothetical protein